MHFDKADESWVSSVLRGGRSCEEVAAELQHVYEVQNGLDVSYDDCIRYVQYVRRHRGV